MGRVSHARTPFFYLTITFAIWILFCLGNAVFLIQHFGTSVRDFGWSFGHQQDAWIVTVVSRKGIPLQQGDRIVSLNGDDKVATIGPKWKLRGIHPGEDYILVVLRQDRELNFRLTLNLKHDSSQLYPIIVLIFSSLSFYLMGILIGLSKPDVVQAKLAAIACFAVGNVRLGMALEPVYNFLEPHFVLFYILVWSLHPLEHSLAFSFVRRFPSKQGSTFWSRVEVLIWSAGISCAGINLWESAVAYLGPEKATQVFYESATFYDLADLFFTCFQVVSLVLVIMILITNYNRVKERNQRRRIRWFVAGLAGALLPWTLLVMAYLVIQNLGFMGYEISQAFDRARLVGVLLTSIAPITAGYAILKHRLFDIRIVIRRSVQYLLARNVLRVLLLVPVFMLVFTILSNPTVTVADLILRSSYLYLLLLAVAALKFRTQLHQWLDQKFFREAYDKERILMDLIDEIQRLSSIDEALKIISDRLDASLHPQSIFIFYRETNHKELVLGYSSGGQKGDLMIPGDSALLPALELDSRVHEIRSLMLPQSEKLWFEELGVDLLVPVMGTDHRLLGILCLGEKKSEEPYPEEDRKLLKALAVQLGIIYENLQLRGEVHREQMVKQQMLSRYEQQGILVMKECPSCGECYDSPVLRCSKDGMELVVALPVERIIDGKYRLEQRIGRGGMGAVYVAHDLHLNRKVAIKIMRGNMFQDEVALRRFQREARASAKLKHENIITVFDYGSLKGGGAYLVMEWVQGFTMRSEIYRAGVITPNRMATWLDQILEGIKAAHTSGIIHRDLKPENIIISDVSSKESVIILDFGLAKVNLPDSVDLRSITVPGTILGTLAYMSPEQLCGIRVDERTDLYSIGAMTIEAITGSPPFSGRSHREIIVSILHDEFVLHGDSPEISKLHDALRKALEKDREKRYQSAEEMRSKLIPVLQACPPLAELHLVDSYAKTMEYPSYKKKRHKPV